MKTKAKLTLAFSALSAVVLATAVTSTFAWFTTQSKANLSTGQMTVSTVSEIKITVTKLGYDTGDAATKAIGDAQTTSAEDSNVALGPVSSADGYSFYAPTSLAESYKNSDMDSVGIKKDWTLSHSNEYVGYVKYGIRVEKAKDNGAARELKFQFSTAVTGTKSAELTNAYRVAFLESTNAWAKGSQVGIYSAAGGTKEAYDSSKTDSNPLNTVSVTTTALPTASATSFATPVMTSSAIDRYYILSAWIEGTDTNATNALAGSTLTLGLEFSLVNA